VNMMEVALKRCKCDNVIMQHVQTLDADNANKMEDYAVNDCLGRLPTSLSDNRLNLPPILITSATFVNKL